MFNYPLIDKPILLASYAVLLAFPHSLSCHVYKITWVLLS